MFDVFESTSIPLESKASYLKKLLALETNEIDHNFVTRPNFLPIG